MYSEGITLCVCVCVCVCVSACVSACVRVVYYRCAARCAGQFSDPVPDDGRCDSHFQPNPFPTTAESDVAYTEIHTAVVGRFLLLSDYTQIS